MQLYAQVSSNQPHEQAVNDHYIATPTQGLLDKINYYRQDQYIWLTQVARYTFNHFVQYIQQQDIVPFYVKKFFTSADPFVQIIFDSCLYNSQRHLANLGKLINPEAFNESNFQKSLTAGVLALECSRRIIFIVNEHIQAVPWHQELQSVAGNLTSLISLFQSLSKFSAHPFTLVQMGMSVLTLVLTLTETTCLFHDRYYAGYSLRFLPEVSEKDRKKVIDDQEILLTKSGERIFICLQGSNGTYEQQEICAKNHQQLIKKLAGMEFNGQIRLINDQYIEPIIRAHNPALTRKKMDDSFLSRARIATSLVRQHSSLSQVTTMLNACSILTHQAGMKTFFAQFDSLRELAYTISTILTNVSESLRSNLAEKWIVRNPVSQFITNKLSGHTVADLFSYVSVIAMLFQIPKIFACSAQYHHGHVLAPELALINELRSKGNLVECLQALTDLQLKKPEYYATYQQVLDIQKAELSFLVACKKHDFTKAQTALDSLKTLVCEQTAESQHVRKLQDTLAFDQQAHAFQQAIQDSDYKQAFSMLNEVASNRLINVKLRLLAKMPSKLQKEKIAAGIEFILVKKGKGDATSYSFIFMGKTKYGQIVLDNKTDAELIRRAKNFSFNGKAILCDTRLLQEIEAVLTRAEAHIPFSIEHKKHFDLQRLKAYFYSACKDNDFQLASKHLQSLHSLPCITPSDRQELKRLTAYKEFLQVQKAMDESFKAGEFAQAIAHTQTMLQNPLTQCRIKLLSTSPSAEIQDDMLQKEMFLLIKHQEQIFIGFKNIDGLYGEKQLSAENAKLLLDKIALNAFQGEIYDGDLAVMKVVHQLLSETASLQPLGMPELAHRALIHHQVISFYSCLANKATLSEARHHLDKLTMLNKDSEASEQPDLSEYENRLSYAEHCVALDKWLSHPDLKKEQPIASELSASISKVINELIDHPLTSYNQRAQLAKVHIEVQLRTKNPDAQTLFDDMQPRMGRKSFLRLGCEDAVSGDSDVLLRKITDERYQLLFKSQKIEITPGVDAALTEKLKTLQFNNEYYSAKDKPFANYEEVIQGINSLMNADHLLSVQDVELFRAAHRALFSSKIARKLCAKNSWQETIAAELGLIVQTAEGNVITDATLLAMLMRNDGDVIGL